MFPFKALRDLKIPLEEIPLERLEHLLAPSPDLGNVRGALMECAVETLLLRAGMAPAAGIPYRVNGYVLGEGRKDGTHVVVNDSRSHRQIHEFDFLFSYRGEPVAIEVKAGSLEGVGRKLARGAAIAREIYGADVPTLVFSPLHASPRRIVEDISRMRGVTYFDFGYARGRLEKMARAYLKRHASR